MHSIVMDINKLVALGVVPSNLADDPIIVEIAKQTRLSVPVRESIIIVYLKLLLG